MGEDSAQDDLAIGLDQVCETRIKQADDDWAQEYSRPQAVQT